MNEDLPPETIKFLAELTKEDIRTLETGLPLIRMVIGFGKVTKWLTLTFAGLLMGGVLMWDAVLKIASWFRGHG